MNSASNESKRNDTDLIVGFVIIILGMLYMGVEGFISVNQRSAANVDALVEYAHTEGYSEILLSDGKFPRFLSEDQKFTPNTESLILFKRIKRPAFNPVNMRTIGVDFRQNCENKPIGGQTLQVCEPQEFAPIVIKLDSNGDVKSMSAQPDSLD